MDWSWDLVIVLDREISGSDVKYRCFVNSKNWLDLIKRTFWYLDLEHRQDHEQLPNLSKTSDCQCQPSGRNVIIAYRWVHRKRDLTNCNEKERDDLSNIHLFIVV